ncbi:MAG: hypothetical protein HUK25_00585 [Treponema sp.]|nr:hypothetical protein [Treponema sp.]
MAKKLSSWLNNLSNRNYLFIWIAFYAVIATSFLINVGVRKGEIGIDADLMNMFPASFDQKAIKKADAELTSSRANNVYILVKNEDFKEAKNAAVKVYDQLKDSPKFDTITLYSGIESSGDTLDFIYKYRWNLLDEETADNILNGGAEAFAENALASVFGAFTMTSLDNLDSDPFMLTEYNLNTYLSRLQNSGTAMSVKDGVLAAQYEGNWYVMISATLSKEGAALASKSNAVVQIHEVCDPLEKDGTRFVYEGTPFHSYKSSTEASKEITIISLVSMLAVVIILFGVFKNPVPIACSVASIFLSIASALTATLAAFGKVHVLTLVFGTSLIGSCIDYSLHYFIHWKANKKLTTGKEIRMQMLKGLSMSLISTVLCFAILILAPYRLLKQMSLFSIVGIISSFLTTICLYPYIPFPKEQHRKIRTIKMMKTPEWYNKKKVGRWVNTGIFLIPIVLLAVFYKNIGIKNDLGKLYTMEGRELQDEVEAVKVLNYNPSGWYIVKGNSENDVLVNEEKLAKDLKAYCAANNYSDGYLGTTLFIPSVDTQKKSRAACEKLLEIAEIQYEYLGFEPECANDLRASFKTSEDDFISIEKGNVPASLLESISSAWLGELDGEYYSVLLPGLTSDDDGFRTFSEDENIFYISKMNDISRDLDKLTKMILVFFAVAYVVIYIILRFFYKTKQALKIISIPVLIMIVVTCVFAIAKIHLEFFSIVGMILVLGLGLDYIIYMMENEKHKGKEDSILEPYAIMLSFVTTVISFGALALSSFKPVHLIGLSIFTGLITAYLSSVFYDRS